MDRPQRAQKTHRGGGENLHRREPQCLTENNRAPEDIGAGGKRRQPPFTPANLGILLDLSLRSLRRKGFPEAGEDLLWTPELAFPDHQDLPAQAAQPAAVLLVVRDVPGELVGPELPVGLFGGGVSM